MPGDSNKIAEFYCQDINGLDRISEEIVRLGQELKVWVFEGEMGAGKTTLIKSICKVFGVVDRVSSPTFSLINEYVDEGGRIFYHFDFYRIENEAEVFEIGVDEYFYSGHFCFIEWPSRISSFIPDEFLRIFIVEESEKTRKIELFRHEKTV